MTADLSPPQGLSGADITAIDDIVASLPMSNLAAQVGSDEQNTEAAVRQVLPALLGGLHANASDPAGAASLAGALDQHSPDLVEGGVDLNQVDQGEGSKIVQNIFGGNTEQVAQNLGGSLQGQTGLVQKLLPILAPIVLSYLAKRIGGQAADVVAGWPTCSAGCSAAVAPRPPADWAACSAGCWVAPGAAGRFPAVSATSSAGCSAAAAAERAAAGRGARCGSCWRPPRRLGWPPCAAPGSTPRWWSPGSTRAWSPPPRRPR